MLKKYITSLFMVSLLGIVLPMSMNVAAATSASAKADTRCYYSARTRRYTCYKRPNFYRRHRKALNIGIGTGVGMLVGGLVGGKKGLVIGGLGGAGGGALFTHYQKPKNYTRRYYHRRY